MKKILSFIEAEEKKILREAGRFHNALLHLRYEGKLYRSRNLKNANSALKALNRTLRKHHSFQERAIFVFLKTRFPKYEAVLQALHTEHEDISENAKQLTGCLRKLSCAEDNVTSATAFQAMLYLTALLRQHVGFENSIIRKSLRSELKAGERREIKASIEKWITERRML